MKVSLLILTLLISGCSSFTSRSDGFGEAYSGAKDAICDNAFMVNAFSRDAFIVGFATLPFTISNLVLSTVIDTVLLPIDLIVEKEPAKPCALIQ